jgi:hypothetical protein
MHCKSPNISNTTGAAGLPSAYLKKCYYFVANREKSEEAGERREREEKKREKREEGKESKYPSCLLGVGSCVIPTLTNPSKTTKGNNK